MPAVPVCTYIEAAEHSGVCTTATAPTILVDGCPRTRSGRIPPKKSGKRNTWTLLLDFNTRFLLMLPPFPLLNYRCSSEPERTSQSRDVPVRRFQAVAVCVPKLCVLNPSPSCSAKANGGHPTSHGDPIRERSCAEPGYCCKHKPNIVTLP